MPSSLLVRRAEGARTPSGKRSVKILLTAQDRVAAETTSDDNEIDHQSRQWKVPDPASIMAMNTTRDGAARWTDTDALCGPDGDNGVVGIAKRTLHNKPGRHQTGAAKCLLHGADSPS